MKRWLRDWWRGYSDDDLFLARDFHRCAKKIPPGSIVPCPMTIMNAMRALMRDGELE